jgi:CIC family chloride channel protein
MHPSDARSSTAERSSALQAADMPGERVRFLTALLLVAVGAGLFAVAFRLSLVPLYRALSGADDVMGTFLALPPPLRLVVPVAGALLAGLIAWWRIARSQGVSNVMEAVALGNVDLSLRTTGWRVAASWSAIGSGMSIGREGPLIEFGGSLGATVARLAGVSVHRARVLVAAGTAAGFAAAYNTPFAAVLFVLEAIVGITALDALLSTMAATVIATTITRAVTESGPIYGERAFALVSPMELVPCALLGAVAAVAAVAFKALLALLEETVRSRPAPRPLVAGCGGLVVGAIAMFAPLVVGNGYEPLNLILDERLAIGTVAVLLVAKVAATAASVASGVPGGIFTPTLLMGGALGALWAYALAAIGAPFASSPGSFALVGMAATTAATIHAPLTAAVMIFELSGDYPIVLPLMLSTIVATTISRWLGSESVYAAELRRRGLDWELTLDGRVIGHARPEGRDREDDRREGAEARRRE